MADSNNNSSQEGPSNCSTDSNLPILFANGYPTSLDKMSRDQLELFIPFLVKCSRIGNDDGSTPVWWPNHIDFKIPIQKPNNYRKQWDQTLRSIIECCYKYFNQPYLLEYSKDLCKQEPANLRYVVASETTTSLYSRQPYKLLLTFRNENMFYDKKPRMKLWKRNETPSPEPDEEESTFNIILCEFCDAEFYSDEAHITHEKNCGSQAELEAPPDVPDLLAEIVISDDEEYETDGVISGQQTFLGYLELNGVGSSEIPRRNNSMSEKSLSPKKKKQNQRTRKIIDKKEKDREKLIPFSSPAGRVLTKKAVVGDAFIEESIKDYEKYCNARPNSKISPRVRQKQTGPENMVIREMRKPRLFYWPRKTAHSISHEVNFEFLNKSLIKEMRECSVVLEKLTDENVSSIKNYMKLKAEEKRIQLEKTTVSIDLCSDSDNDSIIMDDGSKLNTLEELNILQGNIVTIHQSSTYQMMPINAPRQACLSKAFEKLNRSELYFTPSNGSPSTSRVYQTNYHHQQIIINSTQRTRVEDEVQHNQQSIQQWIQTVSGENFCGITN